MRYTEHDEQVKLIQWATLNTAAHPELAMLYAIPNGGQRNIITAAKLKAEGVKSGVPDLFLAVAKTVDGKQKHGLYIEMKSAKGKTSHSQKWWLEHLAIGGYETAVCYSFDEARKAICGYLGI